jgi:hypothetical protein
MRQKSAGRVLAVLLGSRQEIKRKCAGKMGRRETWRSPESENQPGPGRTTEEERQKSKPAAETEESRA